MSRVNTKITETDYISLKLVGMEKGMNKENNKTTKSMKKTRKNRKDGINKKQRDLHGREKIQIYSQDVLLC